MRFGLSREQPSERGTNPSTDDLIGQRELMAVAFFLLVVKGADSTTTFLLSFGGNAGWLSVFVYFAYMLPFLWLVTRTLAAREGLNLIALSEETFGVPATKAMMSILLVLGFAATILNMRPYAFLLEVMFYAKTPATVIYVLLIATSGYLAYLGLETIGRVASLLLPYALLSFGLLFLGVYDILDYDEIFPFFGRGWPLLTGPLAHLGIVVDMLYLAVFLDRVKGGTRTYWNGMLSGSGIAAVSAAVLLWMYVTAFGYPAASGTLYPFQQLTRLAHFGWYINHVEAAFLGIWVLASVVHFAVYIYTIVYLFQYVVGAGDFFRLIVPTLGILFVAGFYPYRSFILQYTYRAWVVYALTATVFPFVIALAVAVRYRFRRSRGHRRAD
ncbi:MAG: GerAB/ArcD/ProY family transporter [Hydrogenibacillus sp.]|nr:GerAB/ArcD/ProY family transporter [Hydrogenibacillus sp.]